MSSVQELERKKGLEIVLCLLPDMSDSSCWVQCPLEDFFFSVSILSSVCTRRSFFVAWCGQPIARTATQFMNIFSWCSVYRCWFAGAMLSEALIAIYLFAVRCCAHNRLWQKYKIETKKTRREHHHHLSHHRQPPIHPCLKPKLLPPEHGWTIYLLWKKKKYRERVQCWIPITNGYSMTTHNIEWTWTWMSERTSVKCLASKRKNECRNCTQCTAQHWHIIIIMSSYIIYDGETIPKNIHW